MPGQVRAERALLKAIAFRYVMRRDGVEPRLSLLGATRAGLASTSRR